MKSNCRLLLAESRIAAQDPLDYVSLDFFFPPLHALFLMPTLRHVVTRFEDFDPCEVYRPCGTCQRCSPVAVQWKHGSASCPFGQ